MDGQKHDMTLEEYEKEVMPKFITELEKAFLAAEGVHPGGMSAWLKSLGEGPSPKEEEPK